MTRVATQSSSEVSLKTAAVRGPRGRRRTPAGREPDASPTTTHPAAAPASTPPPATSRLHAVLLGQRLADRRAQRARDLVRASTGSRPDRVRGQGGGSVGPICSPSRSARCRSPPAARPAGRPGSPRSSSHSLPSRSLRTGSMAEQPVHQPGHGPADVVNGPQFAGALQRLTDGDQAGGPAKPCRMTRPGPAALPGGGPPRSPRCRRRRASRSCAAAAAPAPVRPASGAKRSAIASMSAAIRSVAALPRRDRLDQHLAQLVQARTGPGRGRRAPGRRAGPPASSSRRQVLHAVLDLLRASSRSDWFSTTVEHRRSGPPAGSGTGCARPRPRTSAGPAPRSSCRPARRAGRTAAARAATTESWSGRSSRIRPVSDDSPLSSALARAYRWRRGTSSHSSSGPAPVHAPHARVRRPW